MPDKRGYTRIVIPAGMVEAMVKPMQERIFEQTGDRPGNGMVVRRMIEIAFDHEIRQHCSRISSPVK